MNDFAVNLAEATVALYPANAAGGPVLGSPVWLGVGAESLSLRRRWLKVETRATGSRYPRKHLLVPQYEISLGRVWALPVGDPAAAGVGWGITASGRYVLDVLWTDEDTGDWHRRTFYGVTVSEDALDSRSVEDGLTNGQAFEAEYEAAPTGGARATSVPALAPTLPYLVRYVGADGVVLDLYGYDPLTQSFTETVNGISTGRASLVVDTDGLAVNFDGRGTVMALTGSGLEVSAFRIGAPVQAQVPRVDFFYGDQRMASVTIDGHLYAAGLVMGTVDGPGFTIVAAGGSAAVGMISGPAVALALAGTVIMPQGATMAGGEAGGAVGGEGGGVVGGER